VAGAGRTESALDRFLAYTRPVTVGVMGVDFEAVSRLPQVADADEAFLVFLAPRSPAGLAEGHLVPIVGVHGHLGVSSERPLLVRGRLPDARHALEIAINEGTAATRHIEPGGKLRLWAYTPRQTAQFLDSGVDAVPAGPPLDFTVTGVVRTPNDLSPVPIQQDVRYLGNTYVYLTSAFWQRYREDVASLAVGTSVRLRRGTDMTAFQRTVQSLPGGRKALVSDAAETVAVANQVAQATHVQAVALLVFALLVALAGGLIVGQGIARQVQLETAEQAVWRALGMTRAQSMAAALVRAGLLSAGGAIVAVTLAILASPLAPIGLARQAEIDPGIAVDATVLSLGSTMLVAVVLARAAASAWWASRIPAGATTRSEPRRSSILATQAAHAGASPSAVTGIRMALEPGPPPAAAPARTAIVAAAAAVAAVTASLTFATSLYQLVESPRLQGWNWDVLVGNPNDNPDIRPKAELLEGNPLIAGYSLLTFAAGPVRINGVPLTIISVDPLKGAVSPRILAGREPHRATEIALGQATLRRLNRRLGDVVELTGDQGRRRHLRIVGEVLLPGGLVGTMATGAETTLDGLRLIQPNAVPHQFAVKYSPATKGNVAYESLQADFGRTVMRALPPDDVENLFRVRRLPPLLAGLLALLGAATIGHALVTSVRRRRRDLAVLKALGFVRRQVSSTVAWQATTLAAMSLLIGLPIGVAAGRGAWLLVNRDLGSTASPVTPTLAVMAIIPVTILITNVIAALPARSAAATRPATALRSE
jgi:hypothetical protein